MKNDIMIIIQGESPLKTVKEVKAPLVDMGIILPDSTLKTVEEVKAPPLVDMGIKKILERFIDSTSKQRLKETFEKEFASLKERKHILPIKLPEIDKCFFESDKDHSSHVSDNCKFRELYKEEITIIDSPGLEDNSAIEPFSWSLRELYTYNVDKVDRQHRQQKLAKKKFSRHIYSKVTRKKPLSYARSSIVKLCQNPKKRRQK